MIDNEILEVYRTRMRKEKTPAELFFLKKAIERFRSSNKLDCFKTQVIIGWYIVDFLFPSKRLIIELDGNQHYNIDGKTDDFLRDSYLTSLGFKVLRYSNQQIFLDIDNILNYIDLWASLENKLHNYNFSRRTIAKQNLRKNLNKVERNIKSKECL